MNITINGKQKNIEGPATVEELLKSMDINPKSVAVEHNRTILARDFFSRVQVEEGDTLEVIRLVGGG